MHERVRITDVSARDGLQNEAGIIPAAQKVELVQRLCAAGVDEVEVSSFVSPKWVPQLGDAVEVFGALRGKKPSGVVFSALAPNEKGAQSLVDVNASAGERLIDKMSLFTAASETFNRKNTNAGIDESLERFRPALLLACRERLAVRVYISCVYACPFEGEIAPWQVTSVIEKVIGLLRSPEFATDGGAALGFAAVEIDLGDTIGAATPESTARLLDAVMDMPVRGSFPAWNHRPEFLVLHLHDTFGHAAACVAQALKMGIRSFDASAGGLGGCPYASTPGKRAPGNIATERLVQTVLDAGFTTGVDQKKLREAGDFAKKIVADAQRKVHA